MDEKTIVLAALAMESPQERKAYLDNACAEQPALRERVDALLRWHGSGDSILDSPLFTPLHIDTGEMDDVKLDFLEATTEPNSLGRLGHYEILGVLGRGATGLVLKGLDRSLNRVAAIKVLSPHIAQNPMARRRFIREAQAAAAVIHPNVITIFSVDHGRELPYLAMECVTGKTLQQKIDDEGPLEAKTVVRLATQIAQGLAAAHAGGVIHRDIKPSNILLENNVERVKITDFGLARAVDDAEMTHTGHVGGTPQYMSPEQARGEELDHRSDLFSLGCVLYAMCAGRSPFRADSTIAAIRRVCDDTPRPLREINPAVPEELERVINRLLSKEREHRFQSASEVADVLLGKASLTIPVQEPAVRKRRATPIVAALLLVAVAFAGAESAGWTRVTGLHNWVQGRATPAAPPNQALQSVSTGGAPQPTVPPAPPVVSPVVPPEQRPVKVFIMVGDAPLMGRVKTSLLDYQAGQPETAPLFAHLRRDNDWLVRDDVWITARTYGLNKHGSLTVGYGTTPDRIGPELAFGQVVGDHYDDQVLIIKSGAPGANLFYSLRSPNAAPVPRAKLESILNEERRSHPDWTLEVIAQRVGCDYRLLLADVRETQKQLDSLFPEYHQRGYEIAGLVLFASWLDAEHFDSAEAYTQDLADFIKDVRVDLQSPNLPIVIGQIGNDGPGVERLAGLKSAQAAVADLPQFAGNVRVVPTDVYWDKEAQAVFKKGWREHIDEWNKVGSDFDFNYLGSAKTICGIGRAFGEAMIELQSRSSQR